MRTSNALLDMLMGRRRPSRSRDNGGLDTSAGIDDSNATTSTGTPVVLSLSSAGFAQSYQGWTTATVLQTIGVFILAGFAEIGGGWLVWQTIREHKPWWYCLLGFMSLMAYGVVATLQPDVPAVNFGRTFAVYGGVFVVMSYGWGWLLDGSRPDLGDIIGASIALAGMLLAWFWPRPGGAGNSAGPSQAAAVQ